MDGQKSNDETFDELERHWQETDVDTLKLSRPARLLTLPISPDLSVGTSAASMHYEGLFHDHEDADYSPHEDLAMRSKCDTPRTTN